MCINEKGRVCILRAILDLNFFYFFYFNDNSVILKAFSEKCILLLYRSWQLLQPNSSGFSIPSCQAITSLLLQSLATSCLFRVDLSNNSHTNLNVFRVFL